MKKMVWLTLFVTCILALSAQQYTPKLHSLLDLNDDMSISEVAETLDTHYRQIKFAKSRTSKTLSDTLVVDFKNTFALRSLPDSTAIKDVPLALDDIYQFYCLRAYGYNDFSELGDVCFLLKIPFNVIAPPLNLNSQIPEHKKATIRATYHETLDIEEFKNDYNKNRMVFSSKLLLMSMSLVFIALCIISFVISKIVIFTKVEKVEERLPSVITSVGKVIAAKKSDLSDIQIAAVIAAIHKLKTDTEHEDEIISSWRYVNINMWRASGKANFPSTAYNLLKSKIRGKK